MTSTVNPFHPCALPSLEATSKSEKDQQFRSSLKTETKLKMGTSSDNNQLEILEVAVGKKFQKYYGDGKDTPWLDNNKSLQKHISENKWTRWDGVEGTAESHMDWIHKQAKSLMSDDRQDEFRPYGKKNGVNYSIHDKLTAEGNGYGFFKLEGTFKIEPKDMVACMFDFGRMVDMDDTIVMMKILKTYEQKNKSFVNASYWCNAPGFPFYYRDGLDLSGYKKDEDRVFWQFSVSAKGEDFESIPYGMAAQNRYWAYRLVPNGDGTTKVTLICQTELNGYIPKCLSNYIVCGVLSDYMTTAEESIRKNKESGVHQKLLKQLQLENL
jgi:hypothetical protein